MTDRPRRERHNDADTPLDRTDDTWARIDSGDGLDLIDFGVGALTESSTGFWYAGSNCATTCRFEVHFLPK